MRKHHIRLAAPLAGIFLDGFQQPAHPNMFHAQQQTDIRAVGHQGPFLLFVLVGMLSGSVQLQKLFALAVGMPVQCKAVLVYSEADSAQCAIQMPGTPLCSL